MLFLDQFRDFMILVLIAAALISGFIGELSDTISHNCNYRPERGYWFCTGIQG